MLQLSESRNSTQSKDNPTHLVPKMVDDESISPTTKARTSHIEFEEMLNTDTYKETQYVNHSQLPSRSEYRNRFSSSPVPFSQADWHAPINNTGRQHTTNKMTRHSISESIHHNRLSNETREIYFGTNPLETRQSEWAGTIQEHFIKESENPPTEGSPPQPFPTRIQTVLYRLVGFVPRDRHYQPNLELNGRFQSSIRDIDNLEPIAWLRIAVWWLLKARKTLEHYGRRNSVRSGGSITSCTTSSSTPSYQAYLDLLKASYILYDIVLYDERLPDLLTRECQKVLVELSEGISETESLVGSLGILDYIAGQHQNTNLQEHDLLEEFPSNNGTPYSSLERTNWVTVKLEDAGEEGEEVLFRTFINATSTFKTTRRWTKDAPYILLLSVRDGETEPRITLCNQSGTLCLQRNFEKTDLKDLTLVSDVTSNGAIEARITEPLTIDFDHRRIEVSFQFYDDYMAFIKIPKEYFEAVSLREPIDLGQSLETVLFKSPVVEFEKLKAPEMRSIHPPDVHQSCEVRILERSASEAWSTTRRLVISTSIARKNPHCIAYFLPLSRVDIKHEERSCEVQVKWSNTSQREYTKTDGNYHDLYSYVYDANKPNIGIKLRFRTTDLAEEFEREILGIGHRSVFSWNQVCSRGSVYDVVDADQKPYKAIALYRRRAPWRGTDLFYLYRDSDYIYEHAHLRIRFPGLSYTNYVSNCVGQIDSPTRPVDFSHCEKRVQKNVTVEFDDERSMRVFMSSLASSYELVYSRNAISLTTKSRGILGVTRALSSKGAIQLQLWRKGNHFQLASRWLDSNSDRWLTMSVPLPELRTSGHSNRVEFPQMSYFRGALLDFANILAREPAKHPSVSERKGSITITFATSKDQEGFVETLRSPAARTFLIPN